MSNIAFDAVTTLPIAAVTTPAGARVDASVPPVRGRLSRRRTA